MLFLNIIFIMLMDLFKSSFEAPRKSGINIDVGKKGDAKFGEVLASNNAKSFFRTFRCI